MVVLGPGPGILGGAIVPTILALALAFAFALALALAAAQPQLLGAPQIAARPQSRSLVWTQGQSPLAKQGPRLSASRASLAIRVPRPRDPRPAPLAQPQRDCTPHFWRRPAGRLQLRLATLAAARSESSARVQPGIVAV